MAMHMRQHADTCTNMKIHAHVKILMRMYPQNGSKIILKMVQELGDFLPDPGFPGVRSMGPGLSIYLCQRRLVDLADAREHLPEKNRFLSGIA